MNDTFSIRNGLEIPEVRENNSLSEKDLNRLWNALVSAVDKWGSDLPSIAGYSFARELAKKIQMHFLVTSFLNPGLDLGTLIDKMRWDFHSTGVEWWKILDFLEFIYKTSNQIKNEGAVSFQKILEQEISTALDEGGLPFTFLEGSFWPLTDKLEADEVSSAIHNPELDHSIKEQLHEAMQQLARHDERGFQQAVAASFKAIEAKICQMTETKTMGEGIKSLQNNNKLTSEFSKILHSLWGWASNEPNVRHGKTGESELNRDVAKFVVIQASAILNLLVAVDLNGSKP